MAPTPSWDDDAWEICNDNGFVYKRRRRSNDEEEGPPPARRLDDDHEAELRGHRRARRRQCLLNLRDKYRRELQQWECLSASLLDRTEASATATASSSSAAASPPSLLPPQSLQEQPSAQPGASQQLIEDLVLQVEAQESILRKLSELCDYVEAECKAREENLVQSIIDLPIWGSPRALMASLSD